MDKKGKPLERLVRLIQEALKGDNVQLFSNLRVKDQYGGKREFDVFLKSTINGFEIQIAIECKEYSKPVGIDKIDSFKAKCDSIPGINKKIFVSSSGYTKGAKRNAVPHGITLFEIADLNEESIQSWFPTMKRLRLKLQIIDFEFGFALDEGYDLSPVEGFKPQFYLNGELVCENIQKVVLDTVKSHSVSFWDEALLEFMRNSEKMLNEGIVQTGLIRFPEGHTLITSSGEHIPVAQIRVFINVSLIESMAEIMHASSYGELDKEDTSKQLIVDMGHNTKAEIVSSGDKQFQMFVRNNEGELTGLSLLAVYDPKEDKMKPILEESKGSGFIEG